MCAKCTGQNDAVNGVGVQFVHQKARAREERGFRQLDGADIALRDRDARTAFGAGIVDQIGVGATFGYTTGRAGLVCRPDQAAFVQQSGDARPPDEAAIVL